MRAHHLFTSLVFAFALASPGTARCADTPGSAGTPTKKAEVAVWKHVAVIGASVSAGIGLDPTSNAFAGEKSKTQLAEIIDASLLFEHDAPWNGADFNFFSSPEAIARRSAADAKAEKPTALIAIDYLFWLGYGNGSNEKRLARLEAGLKLLESFTCPVLVGDLSDFHGAGTNPFYLPKESIPPAESLAQMNKAIYAWAKERKNVVVVPLAEMLRKIIVDEPISVGGVTFEKGSKARLLQQDNLHTTLEGTCALWCIAVEAWRAMDPTIPAEAFLANPTELAKKVEAAAASAPVKPKRAKPGKAKPKKAEKAGTGG